MPGKSVVLHRLIICKFDGLQLFVYFNEFVLCNVYQVSGEKEAVFCQLHDYHIVWCYWHTNILLCHNFGYALPL